MPTLLLTSTTYGTWLPGDPRGSVTSVRCNDRSTRVEHSRYGEAYAVELIGLNYSARSLLKGEPILLQRQHAQCVVDQLLETCRYRGWEPIALSVMANHFHFVIDSIETNDARKILSDLKAYASRSLNQKFGKPTEGRWWTSGGSCRYLNDAEAVCNAINYVLHKQPNPLATWSAE